MLITVSLALVFAVVTAALIAAKRVSFLTALMVWLSGFTLAGTGMGVPVTHFLTALINSAAH